MKGVKTEHSIKETTTRYWYEFTLTLLAGIYLFLPNNNPLADSYDYAASVKYHFNLFEPHHLLFNWFNYHIYNLVCCIHPVDALHLISFINALFAIGCLFALEKIIYNNTNNINLAKVCSVFAGCTFGFMRFATESETYILPLFFSLLASLFYSKYSKESKNKCAFYSGLFASIACLFHQIHLFWGIALFVGWCVNKKIKPVFYFALATPLVLIVYMIVLKYQLNTSPTISNTYHYLASYYFGAKADTTLTFKDVGITAITLIRTFFQVHGLVFKLFEHYLIVAIISGIVTVGLAIWGVRKGSRMLKGIGVKSHYKTDKTHLLAFALQFAFAAISHGNSEFMVMLPFALAIGLSSLLSNAKTTLFLFSLSMLTWNLTMGIIPNHYLNLYGYEDICKLLNQHPKSVFITTERNALVNLYYYKFNIGNNKNIIAYDDSVSIHQAFAEKKVVFTDRLSRKEIYSRSQYLEKKCDIPFRRISHFRKINCSMESFYVDRVQLVNH